MAGSRATLRAIREHYDHLSVFYHLLWGPHIHHGYWEGDESPDVAQVQLTTRLAEFAAVPHGARVLDVGCGLGGSALWLVRNRNCRVTGITLSPVQAWLAARQARAQGWNGQVCFHVHDANRLDFPPQGFGVVWVVECSEHLADKERFFASCARVLRQGGRIALCAWLDASDPDRAEHAELVAEICRGMLCPSLARLADYTRWLNASGFQSIRSEDITHRVARTWNYCEEIAQGPIVRLGQRLLGRRTRAFVSTFAAMRRAYAQGALAYGMITAQKA
jgi:tocopherol O-methyltransferase